MRRKCFALILFLFWLSVLGQNPSQNQALRQQQLLEARRENFATGRQLLLNKGVPFDPDELLRDGWRKNLKSALDAMPEMHQARYETAPLKDVYIADTLYLPEKVRLSGHTLILANYVVFEGNNPLIKGNYDIHFFPAQQVAVLGTSLSEALRRKPGLLTVNLARKPVLPSFALIQNSVKTGPHIITFDTSGPPPQPVKPGRRPAVNLRAANLAWFQSVLLQSGDQNTSGSNGNPGSPGLSPPPGLAGSNEPAGADGDCGNPSNGSASGEIGQPGGIGDSGEDGGDGGNATSGFDAGDINVNILDTDPGNGNKYNYIANGGGGGQGGPGGAGANAGAGGNGGSGGNGVPCGCVAGNGGAGGAGGNGGKGGSGGNGGAGGNGGRGGTITVSLPWNSPGVASTSNHGGAAGSAGDAGPAGSGGTFGSAGKPGLGAAACGNFGTNGVSSFAGNPGHSGKVGSFGPVGANGPNGPAPSIIPRSPPPGGGNPGSAECDQDLGGGFAPEQTCGDTSPIIVDTEHEGFHLTSVFTGVIFDISGTGKPVQIAWTDPQFHNAFLALPGDDGLVHNGKELFGNFTPQPPSAHPNGFIALAQFDKKENGGNGDGIIDERDDVFSRLRLWIDENHDGICQPGELHRLPELGVYSLALSYVESRRTDQFGNQFRYKGQVNPGDRKDPRDQNGPAPPGRWTYDVFLVTK